MFNSQKCFDEDVGNLQINVDMENCNDPVIVGLMDVVTINFSVLHPFMEGRINNSLNCTCVVCMKKSGLLWRKTKFSA